MLVRLPWALQIVIIDRAGVLVSFCQLYFAHIHQMHADSAISSPHIWQHWWTCCGRANAATHPRGWQRSRASRTRCTPPPQSASARRPARKHNDHGDGQKGMEATWIGWQGNIVTIMVWVPSLSASLSFRTPFCRPASDRGVRTSWDFATLLWDKHALHSVSFEFCSH